MKLGSCLTAVAILLSMVSCGERSSVTGQAEIQAAEPVNGAQYFDFSQEELYSDWRNENPVYAVFDGKTVQTSGSGITSSNGTVTVSSGGTYVLEGSLEGTLVVDAGDALVRLVMNGLQIRAQDGPAVNVQQADKVVLSLEAGTENILSDSESRSSEEEDAAVYSRDDLVINGEGTLRVNGRYLDGLKGNDDVKIVSGSLQISAVDNGLTGKDSVVIQTADLTVDAGGDGVKASNDTDAEKGLVAIQDGVYRLTAGNDGIQAETTLFIAGGNFELQTGGGSGAAVPSASSSFGRGQQADSSAEEPESQTG